MSATVVFIALVVATAAWYVASMWLKLDTTKVIYTTCGSTVALGAIIFFGNAYAVMGNASASSHAGPMATSILVIVAGSLATMFCLSVYDAGTNEARRRKSSRARR